MDEDIFEVDVAEDEDSELYHHGVRGQAWGVQNGPPYPLGSAGRSAFAKMKAILGTDARGRLKATRAAKQATLNKKLVAAKIKGRSANTADIKNMVQNTKARNSLNKARHEGKLSKEQYRTEKAKLRAERAQYKAMKREAEGKGHRMSARDELKQRIINSGDPRMLNRYGKFLNAEEYKAASDRILQRYDLANARINKFAEKAQGLANSGRAAIDNYNNIRNVLVTIRPSLAGKLHAVDMSNKSKSASEQLQDAKAQAQLALMNTTNKKVAEAKLGNDADKFKYTWAARELSKKVSMKDFENYYKNATSEEQAELRRILNASNGNP